MSLSLASVMFLDRLGIVFIVNTKDVRYSTITLEEKLDFSEKDDFISDYNYWVKRRKCCQECDKEHSHYGFYPARILRLGDNPNDLTCKPLHVMIMSNYQTSKPIFVMEFGKANVYSTVIVDRDSNIQHGTNAAGLTATTVKQLEDFSWKYSSLLVPVVIEEYKQTHYSIVGKQYVISKDFRIDVAKYKLISSKSYENRHLFLHDAIKMLWTDNELANTDLSDEINFGLLPVNERIDQLNTIYLNWLEYEKGIIINEWVRDQYFQEARKKLTDLIRINKIVEQHQRMVSALLSTRDRLAPVNLRPVIEYERNRHIRYNVVNGQYVLDEDLRIDVNRYDVIRLRLFRNRVIFIRDVIQLLWTDDELERSYTDRQPIPRIPGAIPASPQKIQCLTTLYLDWIQYDKGVNLNNRNRRRCLTEIRQTLATVIRDKRAGAFPAHLRR